MKPEATPPLQPRQIEHADDSQHPPMPLNAIGIGLLVRNGSDLVDSTSIKGLQTFTLTTATPAIASKMTTLPGVHKDEPSNNRRAKRTLKDAD